MNKESALLRWLFTLTGLVLVLAFAAGCGSSEDATPTRTSTTPTVELTVPTPVELVVSPRPAFTDTPEQSDPTAVRPTVTSPVPTFTPLPTETATPTPTPEPASYHVQSGDTLLGIAENFGVSVEAIALANGAASSDGLTIIVGQVLQIPLCEVHEVVAGNTLAGIALSCGVSLDDLVTENISELARLGSLNSIPLGFVLTIPHERTVLEEIECDPLPEREQVIEYEPATGEGLFCLSEKYGVTTATLLRANLDRLSDGQPYGVTPLLIPPFDGALYSVSSEDIENSIGLSDLAEWYEVETGFITDWNGNRIQEPLSLGQQLLIAGADLVNGPFRFQQAE
jgi:LysM repeat protein